MSGQRSRVCSHLGLMLDTATHMGFPSSENRCFNSKPPNSPRLTHQQDFCLQKSYYQCTLYRDSGANPMPSEIGVVPFAFGRQTKFIFIVGTLLIIAGLVLIGSRSWKDLLKDVSLTPVGSVVEIPSTLILRASPETNAVAPLFGTDISAPEIDPLSVDRPTPLLIAVDTPTLQPRETTTPQPHLHAFEITVIPPGYRQGYLVHIVAVGETLDTIANRYNTTVQAIIAVNYKLKPPVWVHYPIVIPVDTKEAAGLPAFKVYVVEAYESISAESLADVLGIEANALEFYNLCTSNCQFNKEDVLLIPYAE